MHPNQRKEWHEALSRARDTHQTDPFNPHMNIVQYLAGKVNDKGAVEHQFLEFPKTYWQLQLIFLVIPLGLSIVAGSKPLLADSTSKAKSGAKSFLLFLVTIALLQGAAWDNYGASLGIWVFDQQNMLGFHIPGLPIPGEEYMWILMDTLLSYVFTLRLWTEFAGKPASVSSFARNAGFAFLFGSALLGVALLTLFRSEYAFLGISLAFFCPFIAWQWSHSSHVFLGHWKIWLASWVIPGLWTYVADCVAVNQGIWVFNYDKFTSGIWIGGLIQPEVLLIYVIACAVCSQTAMAVLGSHDRPEAMKGKRNTKAD